MINVTVIANNLSPLGLDVPQVPSRGDLIFIAGIWLKVDRVVYVSLPGGDLHHTCADVQVFAHRAKVDAG